MSTGQRIGCGLPVHHIACLFSVSQATAFAPSASHCYNMAVSTLSLVLTRFLSVFQSHSLSTQLRLPNSSSQSFLASFVKTPLSLTTL